MYSFDQYVACYDGFKEFNTKVFLSYILCKFCYSLALLMGLMQRIVCIFRQIRHIRQTSVIPFRIPLNGPISQ